MAETHKLAATVIATYTSVDYWVFRGKRGTGSAEDGNRRRRQGRRK